MKKGVVILVFAIILTAIAIYTVNGYNQKNWSTSNVRHASTEASIVVNTSSPNISPTASITTPAPTATTSIKTSPVPALTPEVKPVKASTAAAAAPKANSTPSPALSPSPIPTAAPAVEADRNKAKNFTLTDLDGNKVSLSDFKGKKVFLNFWATWCPPCKGEMPDIEKVFAEYKDKDLVILAVDLGEDTDTVQSFIKKNNYNFKILLDSDNSVSDQYSIRAIPTSFFIDKDGNIVNKREGSMDMDEMKQYINELD